MNNKTGFVFASITAAAIGGVIIGAAVENAKENARINALEHQVCEMSRITDQLDFGQGSDGRRGVTSKQTPMKPACK